MIRRIVGGRRTGSLALQEDRTALVRLAGVEMSELRPHNEESLSILLSELREPPAAWSEAAKQLPAARAAIADIVAQAKTDRDYRARVVADLERALQEAGQDPDPRLINRLRAELVTVTEK